MLYTGVSMLVGMTSSTCPSWCCRCTPGLVKMDSRLLEAAYDLGATPWKAFWLVTVPLSRAGIIAGFMLVFIPALGEFVIPRCWAGRRTSDDRPAWSGTRCSPPTTGRASALAVVMIGAIVVPLALYRHSPAGTGATTLNGTMKFLEKHFGKAWMVRSTPSSTLPLLFMIVFSFNSTRQDANFTGFSLRWYDALTRDNKIVEGFFLSLKVAASLACCRPRWAPFAAFVLVRYKRFLGRTLFSGHGQRAAGDARGGDRPVAAAADGRRAESARLAERGMLTIILGHTLMGMAYAMVVVQSRLLEMDHQHRGGRDGPGRGRTRCSSW